MKFYFNFSIILIAIETVANTNSPTVSPAPSAEVEMSRMYKSSGQQGFQSPITTGSTLNNVVKDEKFSLHSANSHKSQTESTALNANDSRVVPNKAMSLLKSSKSSTIAPSPTATAKALGAKKRHENERLLVDSSKTPTTSPAPANGGNKMLKVSAASKSPVWSMTPSSKGGNINLDVESGKDLFNPHQENQKDGLKHQSLKSSKKPSVSPAPSAVGRKTTGVPRHGKKGNISRIK